MMLNTTIDGLKALRLDAMAAALAEQHQQRSRRRRRCTRGWPR